MACYMMSHGHKKGVDTLMRLPKGQTSELEPPPTYKNIPRLSVNIATCVGRSTVWAIPLLLISNYSKTDFRGLFGKREIKANASMTWDFSPKPCAKIQQNLKIQYILDVFSRKNQKIPSRSH